MAGWLVPVAAWLVLPLLSAGECPQKGTGVSGNRGSPASWTGCFFAPRFHAGPPRSPLTHPPSRWAIGVDGLVGSRELQDLGGVIDLAVVVNLLRQLGLR